MKTIITTVFMLMVVCNAMATDFNTRAIPILVDFGIGDITTKFDSNFTTVKAGMDFNTALRKAIETVLSDDEEIESPLGLLKNEFEMADKTYVKVLTRLLNGKNSTIGFADRTEKGEESKDCWIFEIRIPKLSDHYFWAVIDTNNYVYGFN
jgi:hypothetical protein